MPFTLSHPAAVVPLRHLQLPVAALAVGSMVPDLPLFLPGWTYPFSHSLTGLLTVDLAVGVLLTVLWWTVLRAPFVDAMPAWVRARMPARPRWRSALLLAAPAVLLGGVTHVVWDEFTHEGRWGEQHVPWLAARYLGVEGVHWAQGVSSAAGLVIIGWVITRTLLRATASPRPAARTGFGAAAWGAVVIAGLIAAAVAALDATGGLHGAAFAAVTTAVPVAVACAAVAAGVWWTSLLVGARR